MNERCEVCGQPLPVGVTEAEIHRRLDKLRATAGEEAATKVRRELDRQFRSQLSEQVATIRKRAVAQAEATSRRKLALVERKLGAAEIAAQRAVERAVKEAKASSGVQLASLKRKLDTAESAAERAAKKAAKQAATETAKMSRKELDLFKERAAKERAQHAADTGRLKAKVDELSLRLDRQTSEQMGEMAEGDALAALKRAFPRDEIRRIDRGMRGADILHKVIVDGAEVGRIVYECKNASTWQNDWLTKARGYRTEYQTQWVVIASRCFPRREK
jgi:hypothetical protein